MNTFVLLMLLSVVGAAALFIALALYLWAIITELEAIGGAPRVYGMPASLLSKIRMGVRAIEVETGHLAPQVTRLNAGLTAVRDGLGLIESNLAGTIDAVTRQEGA